MCASCGGDDGGGGGTAAPIPIGGAAAGVAGASPTGGAMSTGGTMAGATATGGTMAGTMAGATATGGTMTTGGTGAPVATFAPTFTAIFEEILTNGSVGNCMFGACHGSPPNPMFNGNLQIKYDDKDGAYANMVGVVSTSDMCAGKTVVVPGDPAASLLMQKLSATPPCGMRMPIGAPLTDAHIEQITTWIQNGAMND